MIFKKLSIILCVFVFANASAQTFELGKVSLAELQEKEHPKDPSAAAAILFKKGKVTFKYEQNSGFTVVTRVQTRIKIYKKEGYEWANQAIRFYAEASLRENVYFNDAVTYNLVSGKIEKTKLKSDGEFDEKVTKYWSIKKITMPNVKEGSVIEYEYEIRSPRWSISDWSFQTSIPVNYSDYKTYIPEYFTYKTNQKGFFIPKIIVGKNSNSIVLSSKERVAGSGTKFLEDKIDYIETQTSYLVTDLPAMKDEAFVNNMDNYTSSISHELSSTKFPNSNYEYYSSDWESVVKTIYAYDDFGPELNRTGYFEDDINKLIAGINAPIERIATIFNYVKTSVKWNDYTGYSCNDGVKTAYKNKTGNVAEINLMLTAMLRFAGLNANPVLVSTRNNGITYFPSREAFNYVIAAVETPEGTILLDATEIYSIPNVLPLRDLNWFGRLIRKDGTSQEVDLMPKMPSKEIVNMSIQLKTDGTADGQLKIQHTNHQALEYRNGVLPLDKDNYLEKLETTNNNIEISDYSRENDLDLSKPFVEKYTFKDNKSIEIINDKIYIAPMLFLGAKENPFKQEVREYPVDFGYPTQEKFTISVKIPEGYVVESMPAPISITTGENIGNFKYIIANPDGLLQIVISTDINSAILPADFYPVIKDFFQQMIDKQNEKIVLKKI